MGFSSSGMLLAIIDENEGKVSAAPNIFSYGIIGILLVGVIRPAPASGLLFGLKMMSVRCFGIVLSLWHLSVSNSDKFFPEYSGIIPVLPPIMCPMLPTLCLSLEIFKKVIEGSILPPARRWAS